MNARDYRRSAQAHAMKAVKLMTGQPGLGETEKLARLEHAVAHLASAMAHASAARALAMVEQAPPAVMPVDVELGAMDLIDGLENLLKGDPGHLAPPDVT